jgi:hypothetical protein
MIWRLDPRLAWLIIAGQAVALVVVLVVGATRQSGMGSTGGLRYPMLVIAFQDSAPESAIRETLLAIEGSVVRGPNPQGAYTVEIRLALKSAKDLDRIVEELRSRPQVVRVVEKAF